MASPGHPSDLSDDKWGVLSPLIACAKPGGRPRSVQMRRILNGLFYVLRSGGQSTPVAVHTTFVWVVVMCAWATVLEMYRERPAARASNHFQQEIGQFLWHRDHRIMARWQLSQTPPRFRWRKCSRRQYVGHYALHE